MLVWTADDGYRRWCSVSLAVWQECPVGARVQGGIELRVGRGQLCCSSTAHPVAVFAVFKLQLVKRAVVRSMFFFHLFLHTWTLRMDMYWYRSLGWNGWLIVTIDFRTNYGKIYALNCVEMELNGCMHFLEAPESTASSWFFAKYSCVALSLGILVIRPAHCSLPRSIALTISFMWGEFCGWFHSVNLDFLYPD